MTHTQLKRDTIQAQAAREAARLARINEELSARAPINRDAALNSISTTIAIANRKLIEIRSAKAAR